MYLIVFSTLLTNLNAFKKQFNCLYYYIHAKHTLYTTAPPNLKGDFNQISEKYCQKHYLNVFAKYMDNYH